MAGAGPAPPAAGCPYCGHLRRNANSRSRPRRRATPGLGHPAPFYLGLGHPIPTDLGLGHPIPTDLGLGHPTPFYLGLGAPALVAAIDPAVARSIRASNLGAT